MILDAKRHANNTPTLSVAAPICRPFVDWRSAASHPVIRHLHTLHRLGDDDAIDREFSAVCRAIWGFTLDDFTDDDLSPGDHAWLDQLTGNARSNSQQTRATTPRTTSTGALWRLVGLHLDDPGRGEGCADAREASRRLVPAR